VRPTSLDPAMPDDAHGDPPPGPAARPRLSARTRWLAVAGLLAVAALVRVAVMFYGTLSGEDATVALVAKHVLHGEDFPVFFYRQTYMGSLNGIHLVPALFAFGPSVFVVRLNAIGWSLLFPLGVYLLGRRVFGEAAGRAALALAAVPPFLLTYWSTVAEPHFETNLFGVWLLLLALTALTAPSEPARTRTLAVFGLLAGLAWWTSFKAIEVLAPALALLVLRGPRGCLTRGGGLLAGGFLLGSLPAWLFYALHGDPAGGTPGSAVKLFSVGVDLSAARLREFWEEVILRLFGTYYWGSATSLRRAALALNVTLYVAALGFAVLEALRRRREAATVRDWGLWLLLLTLPASLGALYLSPLGTALDHESSRYILPAYIPLLVSTGALVARAGRRSRALGHGVLAFLLAFDLWTHAGFLWPLSPAIRAREAAETAARDAVRQSLSAHPVDAFYVNDSLRALVWAFLLDHPPVSAIGNEIYVPNAVAADAAERIAILGGTDVASDLAALGATWRATSILNWRLYEDIRAPERGYRMVPRRAWRVPGDPAAPAVVADGNFDTAWRAGGQLRGSADGLVVDLGRRYRVARVVFWPSVPTTDVFPLRLSGSVDGGGWEPLGVVPAVARLPAFVASGRPVFRPRNGWLELVLTPRRLRYLRLEPAEPVGEAPWGVAELQVYQETGEAPASPMAVNGVHGLVARLRARGVDRLLADPVVSARVARAMQGAVATLVANGVVDNHGAAPPAWLTHPVRLRAHDGLLVPAEDAPELRERLEAVGMQFLAEPLGAHTLFRVLAPLTSTAPCQRPGRRAAGPESGGGDRLVLEAGLGDETLLSGVRFRHPPEPASGPKVLQVTLSGDGRAWRPADGARVVPEWAWAGRTLFAVSDGVTEVVFVPTPARAVRVAVAQADPADFAVLCVRGTRVR
jgi:4-amino-4-deoxy-L-arabinose transferase-like glycosyltransferase